MACECNCNSDKKPEEVKDEDKNVELAKEIKKEEVEAVEAGTVEGE